ncbi:unnamed protein product [Cunninghamella blakesleeana]
MAEEENDAWDDWETAADAGLADFKKPIEKKKPSPPIIKKQVGKKDDNDLLWEKANEYSTPTIIRTDTVRTQYQPEIKLLKRSPNQPPGINRSSGKQDTQPIKTLAEREKEYLLARERIFGEKKS